MPTPGENARHGGLGATGIKQPLAPTLSQSQTAEGLLLKGAPGLPSEPWGKDGLSVGVSQTERDEGLLPCCNETVDRTELVGGFTSFLWLPLVTSSLKRHCSISRRGIHQSLNTTN
ncbi:unnamed protein product [Boreogadus saida]